jgi:hypothetical protein
MTTEELLRDALEDDAGASSVAAPWDEVRGRGARIRRRRRVAQGGLAAMTVIAIVLGVLAIAGVLSDGGGGTRRGVVATPTPAVGSNEIVVDRGDRIEIIDSTDGHVITTVASRIDSNPGGVSATPDGAAVVYTRQSSTGRCGSEIVEQPLTPGGRAHVIVGHAWDPLVSPDGQWVAYVMNESCESPGGASSADFLGITDLGNHRNYRPYEQELGDHPAKLDLLAWSPDSGRLLYNELRAFPDGSDQKTFVLTDPPLAGGLDQTPLTLSSPISAATYLSNDRLLVARPNGDRSEAIIVDATSGEDLGTRFTLGSGVAPSRLVSDPGGRGLLVLQPQGTLLIQHGTTFRVIGDGVFSVGWLPPPAPSADAVSVPNVIGLTRDEATGLLTRLGFDVTVFVAPGPAVPGSPTGEIVVSQSVVPGTPVAPGTDVDIYFR